MGGWRETPELVSAGGLVYRAVGDGLEIVTCGRGSPRVWSLPKGTPEPGETREQTAIREVCEETGLEVQLKGFVDSTEYWFVRAADKVRCHKRVLFYLMRASGGDVVQHDGEFDEVRWCDPDLAMRTLNHPSEARIVEKGVSLVRQISAV